MVVHTVILNSQAEKGLISLRFGLFGVDNVRPGLTVAEYRDSWRSAWNIPYGTVGHVDGWPVTDDYVVQAGQVLTFHKKR